MKSPAATLFLLFPMVLLFSMVGATAWSQEPVPLGDQFQVNTYTTSNQLRPSVGVDADGNFIVAWESYVSSGTDNDSTGIQGQRYDTVGAAIGGEFQVNTYTTSSQRYSSVGVDADGDFIVVWASLGSSGTDISNFSILGQRFDAAGTAIGDEFQINSFTTDLQSDPSVALSANGSFVVVWDSYGSSDTDTSARSIQGQRFDAAGTAVGGEFQINSFTTSAQQNPWVGVDANGNFVVVWDSMGSSGTDSSSVSIQGQRFNAAGAAIDGEFQVNTDTTYQQKFPSVAVKADGNFVVVWESNGSSGKDSGSFSIQGQVFDAAGAAIGGEFQVNTYTTGTQFESSVGVDADGNFVVVWSSAGSSGTDSNGFSAQGQRFDAAGAAIGGEFQVNTFTTSSQRYSSVGVHTDGDFIVVWQSNGSSGTDISNFSIQGQRFTIPIFIDGFESGDTSAWSSTQ